MKIIKLLSRLIVGIVFVFSGFVKGMDPLGTTFRIQEYIYTYGMDWAINLSLPLAILLCAVEFTIGFSMLFNVGTKITKWLLLLMMIFFTTTTFIDAFYNLVPDCGCFGDAIKLTPWETFWKNILLLIPTLIILLYNKPGKPWLYPNIQNTLLIIIFITFGLFSYWSYRHLPLIDFMEWKVGNYIYPEKEPLQYYFVYKNNNNQEKRQWLDSEVPYEDSVFNATWTYDTVLIKDPNKIKYTLNLHLYNNAAEETTEQYLRNPQGQYAITSYDVSKLTEKQIRQIGQIEEELLKNNKDVIILFNGMNQDIDTIAQIAGLKSEIFNIDDTTLKMMIRANPGLIVFRNGYIIGKWNLSNIKNIQQIEDEINKTTFDK